MFTDLPLSATLLQSRLQTYRFFGRTDLPLSVVRNALHAAKLVARASPPPDPLNHRICRPSSIEIAGLVNGYEILDKIYAFPPTHKHASALWRDLLLMKPYPPLPTTIALLNKIEPHKRDSAISACIRVCLSQNQFLTSFELLDLISCGGMQWCAASASLLATGLASAVLWLNSPVVSSALFGLWAGLAAMAWQIGASQYPYVQFDRHRVSKLSQLRRQKQLAQANAIVAAFNELGTTNTGNYHRRARKPEAPPSVLRGIDQALVLRGMQRRPDLSTSVLLYADYWSSNVRRWQNVEWHEPDQDPAEFYPEVGAGRRISDT